MTRGNNIDINNDININTDIDIEIKIDNINADTSSMSFCSH